MVISSLGFGLSYAENPKIALSIALRVTLYVPYNTVKIVPYLFTSKRSACSVLGIQTPESVERQKSEAMGCYMLLTRLECV